MRIEEIKDQLEAVINSEVTDLPGYKAILILSKYFRIMNLPVKHIGKIRIDLNDSFFDDEILADKIIETFVKVLLKIKVALDEEFGEDSEIIFADTLRGMSLTYSA